MTTEQQHNAPLFQFDDYANNLLSKKWKGSIMMDTRMFHNGILEDALQPHNLCLYFGFGHNRCTKLYFDSNQFPPPDASLKTLPPNCHGFEKLKIALRNAGHSSGSPIVANGSKQGQRRFCCSACCRVFSPGQGCPTDKKELPTKSNSTSPQYRTDSIVNSDKAGRRKNGRSLARRTSTKRALELDECCHFSFQQVGWDQYGFYLNPRADNATHSFHPRVDTSKLPLPSALIPPEKRHNLQALAEACVGSGVGRNFMHSKLGRHISRAKIAYIQKQTILDDKHNLPASDIGGLLDFFRESPQVSFQVLWDCPAEDDESTGALPPSSPNCDADVILNDSSRVSPSKLISTCYDRDSKNNSTNRQEPTGYVDHSKEDDFEQLGKR